MDIALTISNRQISPAVVNLFQFENGTTTLNFALDSYMYGEVNLRNYKAYAVTSINGNIDMTELVMSYDASKDTLTLSWDVKEFTLLEAGAVVYQIVFKEATASGIPDEGENTAVFYTYKAILINREAVDADNEISAKYPTLLKQWLDRMNAMAEMYDVGAVYMKYGQSIPPADRLAGKLYVQYTDTLNTRAQFEDEKGNVLGEYDVMHLVGDETIAGQKSFTTSPKVPTPDADDNSTKAANTEFVNNAVDDALSDFDGKYLPRSGGAMTVYKAIYRDVSDSYLALYGGTGNNDGAQLDLCGANHTSMPGVFQLHARNADVDYVLRGRPDGMLLWDTKYVLNNSFTMTTDGGAIMLTAGTSSTGGAYLRMYGKDHSSGQGTFHIAASDGTTSKVLKGTPDGSLTWGGRNVVTATQADNTVFRLYGGTAEPNGPYIMLYGKDSPYNNTQGDFGITARNGDAASTLRGQTDGTLTWNGINISAMSKPSGTYKNLTLGASGSTYTAPADGWVFFEKVAGTAGAYISLASSPFSINEAGVGAANSLSVLIPIRAGVKLTVYYTATGATNAFRFIYAEGAKHLAS